MAMCALLGASLRAIGSYNDHFHMANIGEVEMADKAMLVVTTQRTGFLRRAGSPIAARKHNAYHAKVGCIAMSSRDVSAQEARP
jgi:hypothetical protein